MMDKTRLAHILMLVSTLLVAFIGDLQTIPGGVGDKTTKWLAILSALLTNILIILKGNGTASPAPPPSSPPPSLPPTPLPPTPSRR